MQVTALDEADKKVDWPRTGAPFRGRPMPLEPEPEPPSGPSSQPIEQPRPKKKAKKKQPTKKK